MDMTVRSIKIGIYKAIILYRKSKFNDNYDLRKGKRFRLLRFPGGV